MVLDLYLIALCGNSNGEVEQKPVRNLYNLTDGIIGGEGDGPAERELPWPEVRVLQSSVEIECRV